MSYILGHPIKRPQDFYGRRHEITRFYEIIGGTQAQSISILGLRRAGKTSFLQYIAHPDVMAQYLPDPERYTMVYLDVSTCKTPADFYRRLLVRLRGMLGDSSQVNLWKALPLDQASMYEVETLLCHFPRQRVILLLDEFDRLRSHTFDQDFLIELRAMTGVLDYDLACVTASYWDLYTLGNRVGLPPTSPFYNIFYPSPIYLAGLAPAESQSLIAAPTGNEGITFDDEEIASIKHLAGSLPFFVQVTAARWLEERRLGAAPDPARLQRQLAADLTPYFHQWWRNFDTGYRELLRCVAYEVAIDILPYSALEIQEAVRRLTNYGLLRADDQLAINGAIFATWIADYSERADATPAELVPHAGNTDPAVVRQALVNHFSLEELRTLCFDIGIDFEELPGSSKSAKARDLVQYWHNRRDLDRLVDLIRRQRGEIL